MSILWEKVSPHLSRFLFAKKYTTFGRQFMAFVLKMQSACPGEHFEGKQIFEKNKSFHLFRALRGKISNCRQTKVSRVFKKALYVSRWFSRGVFSWNNINVFPLSPPDFEQTTMGLFAEKNQQSRQNCILRLQRNVLRFFSENLLFFSSLLDFICKVISNFWRQKSGLLVKNAVWVSKGTFWKKRLFWKKYIFMSLLIVFDFQPFFFQKIGENVSARLIKLHFTCPGEEFEQKRFFCKSSFFIHFGNFRIEKFEMFAEKVQQGRQDCILCDQMKVLRGFFLERNKFFWFSDVEQKIFGLLAKFSGRLVKTVIYVSTETFRWLLFWKEDTSFHSFPTLTAKNYPTFRGKYWQDFQNFNLVVQGNILRKKSFSRTKMSIILLLWAKTSRKLGKKFWTRIVKTAFYV